MDAIIRTAVRFITGLSGESAQTISRHYEFIASYTWSHAMTTRRTCKPRSRRRIANFPAADRSTSLFDQRHRFVSAASINRARSRQRFWRQVFSN